MKLCINYKSVLKNRLLTIAAIAAMLIVPQSVLAEDIVISPAPGSEIGKALSDATSGKTVTSITINLTKGANYTISKSLVTPNSLVINGNGATIDASENSGAFIKMDETPGVAANSKGYYEIANITIKDININDIKERMFYDNGKKYVIMNFIVNNCVLKLKHGGHYVSVVLCSMGEHDEQLVHVNKHQKVTHLA